MKLLIIALTFVLGVYNCPSGYYMGTKNGQMGVCLPYWFLLNSICLKTKVVKFVYEKTMTINFMI